MLRRLIDSARLLGAGPGAVRGAVTVGASLATAVAADLAERLPTPDRVVSAAAERVGRIAAAATRAAGAAAALGETGHSVTDAVRHEAAPSARALLDLHPDRARRRVWAGHGHAQIEVRG